VAGSSKLGNQLLGSTKGGEYADELSDYQNFAPWSELGIEL
jgi:hypothetical protein